MKRSTKVSRTARACRPSTPRPALDHPSGESGPPPHRAPPAPATAERGNQYGGQWWLVPDNVDYVPQDAYSTAGNRGQYVVVVPSHDLALVRLVLDRGRQGLNRRELTRWVRLPAHAARASTPPQPSLVF